MFADDISVLISDSDTSALQIKIDTVVTELETWLNRNNPVINTGKTEAMSLHNGQPHFLVKPLVTFNKTAVAYTSETNLLGIQITDTLKWHSHIQLLAIKQGSFYDKVSEGKFKSVLDPKHLLCKIPLTPSVWYIMLGGFSG
jgi:hypothetical protein